MSRISIKGLNTLFKELREGSAECDTYQFGKYKIKVSGEPLTPAERVRLHYANNPKAREKSNAMKRKLYHERKKKGLCVQCGKALNEGVLCDKHKKKT